MSKSSEFGKNQARSGNCGAKDVHQILDFRQGESQAEFAHTLFNDTLSSDSGEENEQEESEEEENGPQQLINIFGSDSTPSPTEQGTPERSEPSQDQIPAPSSTSSQVASTSSSHRSTSPSSVASTRSSARRRQIALGKRRQMDNDNEEARVTRASSKRARNSRLRLKRKTTSAQSANRRYPSDHNLLCPLLSLTYTSMSDFRVLSEEPLNSEPPLETLASSIITPQSRVFHRNHGDIIAKDLDTYSLSISSELEGVELSEKLTFQDLEKFETLDVVTAIACAGNRRQEMNEEKEVEGLLWGGSAIANSKFSGPLLRNVLDSYGITSEKLLACGKDVHIHFETSQQCEDAEFYGSSLPVSMALDSNRPVLLATRMNGEPLDAKHGFPLRVVAPGIIGARSVKWLERVVIRDRPSDNFYMTRDYKILPPEATLENKEEFLKQVEPMMELPLNSEICEPADGGSIQLDEGTKLIQVRGYALGAKGTPIGSVQVVLVPLPLPDSAAAPDEDLTHSELHRIRLFASKLPEERWTKAMLVDSVEGEKRGRNDKNWGWTLFSAAIEISQEVVRRAEGGESKVALVAYATDVNGEKQELQTPYNLRGVAEASWPVSRIKFQINE
ncbi:hypothetical protein JCM3765_000003 [Sporobolomyces pararoseus]